MALQTWVARFVVDHGQVTEEGGRLRTFPRRRLDEPEVDLYLLAEPHGPNAADLGAQALDAIGRLFVTESLSLTGGLVRSLRSTHQTLLDWNRRSIAREQVGVGVTAVIVRGATLYLTQVGPSVCYLRRGGGLERLTPSAGATAALGEGEPNPEVRRIDLGPGDLLLASSANLEALIDEETLEGILNRFSENPLPELYLLTKEQEAFAVFAVICFEGGGGETESAASGNGATFEEGRNGDRLARGAVEHEEPPLTFTAPPTRPAPAAEAPTAVLVAPRPVDISRPVVRLRRDETSGRGDYTRATGPGQRFHLDLTMPQFLAILAAAFLVFIFFFTVPDLVAQNRTEKAATLVERAVVALAAAGGERDAAKRRALLEEARRLSGEALRLEIDNQAAQDARQQAVTGLAAMDAILTLDPLTTVATLGRQVTGDVSVEGVEVVGSNAYLLDTKGKRVFAVPLSGQGQPTVVFQDGETYAGTPAKGPSLMTWDPSGGGRLLILDSERKLFEMRTGGGPQPVGLRRTNAWSSATDIAAFDGNLYVLDPRGNQIHKYLPAASGFDSEPGPALTGVINLTGAQSLAVSGDIFVAMADGRMRRFRGGIEAAFGLGGIERPLVSPTSVSLASNGQEIYVADTGNKRIVVADKDGNFLRQFVSNAFTDLRVIAVDAGAGQVYAVVGDSLLTAPLVR